MKRPSFQFYPSDWLRDTALRSCSTGARGLWIDMICFMHEGKPYGHLKVGDKVILPSNLARMVGETLEVVEGWLGELSTAGVYELTDENVIYSKRMIRDENLRQIRAAGGFKGGNPMLIQQNKDNDKVNLKDKQKSTPSSSSSSSSSNKKQSGALVLCPPEVLQQTWDDWMIVRKQKNAKSLTTTAWTKFKNQVEIAGWTLEQAISHCCLKNWVAFDADWIKQKYNPADVVRQTVPSKPERDPELVRLEEERKLAVKPNPEMMAKLKQFTNGIKI